MSAPTKYLQARAWSTPIGPNLESADAAVVLVDHDSFDRKLVAEVSTLVLDTRNCLSSAAHNRTALS